MHEFVAKKGLISQGNAQVSGSLTVANGINAQGSVYLDNSYIFSNTSASAPASTVEGQIWWDKVSHTYAISELNSQLQIGQENYVRVIADEFIPNGTAVYLDGSDIDPDDPTTKLPLAYLAIADGNGDKYFVAGISTQDISAGERGFITTQGVVNDLDTSAFFDGDALYLSTTQSGSLTNVFPNDPYEKVRVGINLYAHPSKGRVLVNITILPALTSPYVGMIEIPTFVDNGNHTFTVGAAQGNFCTTIDGLGQIKTHTIPEATFSSSVGTFAQYVFGTYNSGSPIYISSLDMSLIDEVQTIPVFSYVQPLGVSPISPLDWDRAGILLANKLHEKTIGVDGVQRESGLILSVTGSKYIAVTSGSIWYGVKNVFLLSTDTTDVSTSPLSFYYHSASVWTAQNLTTGSYINSMYDDGENLQTASYGSYIVNYIYRTIASPNRTVILLSDALPTLTDAQIFAPPDIPSYFSQFTTLVGRIIVQSGSFVPVTVDSAYKQTLPITITPQHNDLKNIQGGTSSLNANEYYHLTSASYARVESGALDTASYLNEGATLYLSQSWIESATASVQPPWQSGRMFWDSVNHTYAIYNDNPNVTLQLGQENFVHVIAGEAISNGQAVYIDGPFEDPDNPGNWIPTIYKAIADTYIIPGGDRAIGLATHNFTSGSLGWVSTQGIIHDVDTSAWNGGDILYLSPTIAGGYQNYNPGQPYSDVEIGTVINSDVNGSILVSVLTFASPSNAFAGMITTPTITNNNDGTVTISTGSVNLYDNAQGIGIATTYPLSETTLTLVTGSTNYINAYYSGSGTAAYELVVDDITDGTDKTRVAILDIYTGEPSGTIWDVHVFTVGVVGLALSNKANNKDIHLYGYQRQDGLTLYAGESSGSFGITPGTIWYGPNSHVIPEFNSTASGVDVYHFVSSGSGLNQVWTRHTQSGYDNEHYNDVGGIVPLTPNSWSANFVYRLVGASEDSGYDDVALVLSTRQFATELEASDNSRVPENLPDTLRNASILVGRVIVQSGSFTPVIDSAFSNIFVPAVVTQHNSLLGLQGGQGGEYYHLSANDYTGTGTGVMVRTNNAAMTNARLSGSLLGTASYSQRALSASHALTSDSSNAISFVPTTAVSSSWVSASAYIINSDSASLAQDAISASYVPNLYPQEYIPSASWASASISSSYSVSASAAISASYVPNLYPQETIPSASWVSASAYIINSDTASYMAASQVDGAVNSASFSITSSYLLNYAPTVSASWASASLSSSIAYTASSISFVPNSAITSTQSLYATQSTYSTQSTFATQSVNAYSSSWVSASAFITTAATASYVTASNVAGTVATAQIAYIANAINFIPSAATSASWVSASVKITTADTASFVTASNVVGRVALASSSYSASYTLSASNAISASYARSASNAISASYASTSSYLTTIQSYVFSGSSDFTTAPNAGVFVSTPLSFSVNPGEAWSCDAYISVANSNNKGTYYAINSSNVGQAVGSIEGFVFGNLASNTFGNDRITAADAQIGATKYLTTSLTGLMAQFHFTITNPANATVFAIAVGNNNNGNTITVYRGSYLIARRLI